MNKRPVIGVIPLMDYRKQSYWMLPGYFGGISEAGGFPVMLPLTSDQEQLIQAVEFCNGFLFTGGQDVTPSVYNEYKTENRYSRPVVIALHVRSYGVHIGRYQFAFASSTFIALSGDYSVTCNVCYYQI